MKEITIGSITINVWEVWIFVSVLLMVAAGWKRYAYPAGKRLRRVWIAAAGFILAAINIAVFYAGNKELVLQRVEEFRASAVPSWMTVEAVCWATVLLMFVAAWVLLMLVAFVVASTKKSWIKERRRERSARRTVHVTNVKPSNKPVDTSMSLNLPERVVVSTDIATPSMNTK